MDKLFNYHAEENRSRRTSVKKDPVLESGLFALNKAIKDIDIDKIYPSLNKPSKPIIFVLGMQRSGTTVLTQVLQYKLTLATVNNFIAKFWDNPVMGAILYTSIYGNSSPPRNLESYYGKTKSVHAPHEFSYFWQKHFRMDNLPIYNPAKAIAKIDWIQLKQELETLTKVLNKPLVMKGFDLVFHLKKFAYVMPSAYFVFIERDTIDNAVSLYEGRQAYYGDPSIWLGSYPDNYGRIKSMEPKKQILEQVKAFNRMFKAGLEGLPENRHCSISYENLAKQPEATLNHIVKKLEGSFENSLAVSDESISELIKFNTYQGSPLYRSFKKLY